MIVECKSCETRFQLDDARIPPQGVRVRCSRCKEAFFLPHPSQSSPDLASAPSPGATQDLTRTAIPPEPELDEEDWEFSENVPGIDQGDAEEEPAEAAPQAEPDSDADPNGISDHDLARSIAATHAEEEAEDGAVFGSSDVDFAQAAPGTADFDDDDDGEDALVSRDLAAESGADASPFGQGLEDTAAAAEPMAAAAEPMAAAVEPSTSAGEPVDEDNAALAALGLSAEDEEEPVAPVRPLDAAIAADLDGELDDPSSWDFFAGEDAPEEESSEDPAESLEWSDDDASSKSTPTSHEFVDAPLDVAHGTGLGVAHYLSSGVALSLQTVGWTFTLALTAFALWGALQMSAPDAHASMARETTIGALRVESLDARWVDTERLGTVLVVSGELRNPSPAEAVPGMRVEVALLDAAGESIGRSAFNAGAPLAREALRRSTQSALVAHSEAAANALAWTPIPGGESAPFEAWLLDVPHAAARFDVRGEPLGADFAPDVPVPLEADVLPRDPLGAGLPGEFDPGALLGTGGGPVGPTTSGR